MLFSDLPCLRTSPRTSLPKHTHTQAHIERLHDAGNHALRHPMFRLEREREGGREEGKSAIHACAAPCNVPTFGNTLFFRSCNPWGSGGGCMHIPQMHPFPVPSNVPDAEERVMAGAIEGGRITRVGKKRREKEKRDGGRDLGRMQYPRQKRARGACAQEARTGQHKMLTREARGRSRASTRQGGAR